MGLTLIVDADDRPPPGHAARRSARSARHRPPRGHRVHLVAIIGRSGLTAHRTGRVRDDFLAWLAHPDEAHARAVREYAVVDDPEVLTVGSLHDLVEHF